MSRDFLEQHQVWVYFSIIPIAAIFGLYIPSASKLLGGVISLVIAILMYSMFSQIPFTDLRQSLHNRKFIAALVVVNYIAVPIVVWLLTRLLPNDPAIVLGVCLVLLAPCIDYVIVFTALGHGNEKLMLAATPLLFITQMLLLPIYLTLFIGREAAAIIEVGPFAEAFVLLIILPLFIAIIVQFAAQKSQVGEQLLNFSSWLPVPFMALTLIVIVSSQISGLSAYIDTLIQVIPIYIAFMIIMPFISTGITHYFKLDIKASRAVVFSGATRNSLAVLPLALALPAPVNEIIAAIIVTQTIVELIGELIYIRFVPILLKDEKSV